MPLRPTICVVVLGLADLARFPKDKWKGPGRRQRYPGQVLSIHFIVRYAFELCVSPPDTGIPLP
jgi:hypothetical protein